MAEVPPADGLVPLVFVPAVVAVGRSDTNKGRTLKESHTYEKRPT
jgi:hypothetical protein